MAIPTQEGHTSVMNTTRATRATAVILAVAIFGDATTLFAQSASPVSAPIVPVAMSTATDGNTVRLLAGRSTIVDVGIPIARVSLTSPDVADAMVTTPNQLLIHGKVPGTISLFVWDRAGAVRRFEVTVGRDLSPLGDQLRQLFPGERVEVQSNGKNIVIAGNVSSKDLADKIAAVAAGYVEKKDDVVSLLQVNQAPQASQVLLRVRFAEVSRSAMTDLGASIYGDGAKNLIGRSTTGQFGQPAQFDQQDPMVGQSQVFSDFLNLFLFSYKHQVGAVIKALQTKGLFQSLAEPNLVAESGKEASFLAGGEIPVPVVQGGGGNLAVSVMWKEFGVRLNFTPTVNGNHVRLKVKPEVSTLDFGNAITLQGFRIPALSTRRTETELELEDGQTFAIAGLMNNQVSSTMQKIPGIGDIPVLGALFRSRAAQKDQTELVVMITPEILKFGSSGVTPELPRTLEKFMEPMPEKKTHELPPPAFTGKASGRSADAAPTMAPMTSPTAAPARTKTAPTPSAAAATLGALTASPRTVTNAPMPAKAEPVETPVAMTTAAPAVVAPAVSMPVAAPVPAAAVAAPVNAAPVAMRGFAPAEPAAAPAPGTATININPVDVTPIAEAAVATPTPAAAPSDEKALKAEQKAAKKAAEQAARDQRQQEKAERKAAEQAAKLEQAEAKAQARRDADAARKQQALEKKLVEAGRKESGGVFANAQ